MTDERPTTPGIHVPPPFVFAAAFLLGLALDHWVIEFRLGDASRLALVVTGWLLIALGLGAIIWAVVTFTRARTTVLPFRAATAMVTSGPYRLSRNPMYVGMILLYLGFSLVTGMAWPLVMLPPALGALAALVIRREERYLEAVFGAQYAAYRARVRRWI